MTRAASIPTSHRRSPTTRSTARPRRPPPATTQAPLPRGPSPGRRGSVAFGEIRPDDRHGQPEGPTVRLDLSRIPAPHGRETALHPAREPSLAFAIASMASGSPARRPIRTGHAPDRAGADRRLQRRDADPATRLRGLHDRRGRHRGAREHGAGGRHIDTAAAYGNEP